MLLSRAVSVRLQRAAGCSLAALQQLTVADVIASLQVNVLGLVNMLSFAGAIFSGAFAPYLALGISIGALTNAFLAVALGLQGHFFVAGLDLFLVPFYEEMAANVQAGVDAPEELLPTLLLSLALGNVGTGLAMTAAGSYKLARVVQYLPYPVAAGFLSGVGWLILLTGLKLGGGSFVSWPTACTVLLGVAIVAWARLRPNSNLGTPVCLLGATVAYYLTQMALQGGGGGGDAWTFDDVGRVDFSEIWTAPDFSRTRLDVVLSNASITVTMAVMGTVKVLLGLSALQRAFGLRLDLNEQLIHHGVANVAIGSVFGAGGMLLIAPSISAHQTGARSRMPAVALSLVHLVVFLSGTTVFTAIPKFVFGGAMAALGGGLLLDWCVLTWLRVSREDHFVVVLILLLIATLGTLVGVGAGIAFTSLLFAYQYSQTASFFETNGKDERSNVTRPEAQRALLREVAEEAIVVIRLRGYLCFAVATGIIDRLEHNLRLATVDEADVEMPQLGPRHGDVPHHLVLDMQFVPGMDSSALFSLQDLAATTSRMDWTLVMSGLRPEMEAAFRRCAGKSIRWGEEVLFTPDLDHALELCENRVLGTAAPAAPAEFFSPEQLLEMRRDESRAARVLEAMEDAYPHVRGRLGALAAVMEPFEAPAGMVVFKEGEAADSLFIIESGYVHASAFVPGAKLRQIKAGPGTLVGGVELCIRSAERLGSAVADTPCAVFRLKYEACDALDTETALALYQLLAHVYSDRLAFTRQTLRGVVQVSL